MFPWLIPWYELHPVMYRGTKISYVSCYCYRCRVSSPCCSRDWLVYNREEAKKQVLTFTMLVRKLANTPAAIFPVSIIIMIENHSFSVFLNFSSLSDLLVSLALLVWQRFYLVHKSIFPFSLRWKIELHKTDWQNIFNWTQTDEKRLKILFYYFKNYRRYLNEWWDIVLKHCMLPYLSFGYEFDATWWKEISTTKTQTHIIMGRRRVTPKTTLAGIVELIVKDSSKLYSLVVPIAKRKTLSGCIFFEYQFDVKCRKEGKVQNFELRIWSSL